MALSRFPLGRRRTTLQLLCAMANLATTCRYLHDYQLPLVFISLPLVLITIPLVERFTQFLDDPFTRTAVVGVATGVNCGFLSTVANVYRTQLVYMSSGQPSSSVIQVLELLHIPILALTWVDSFLRLLTRLPTQRSLQVAALTALVFDLLLLTVVSLLSDDDLNTLDATNLFLLVYIHALLLACMPLFRDASRAWVLLLTAFSGLLQWQVGSLGVATWNLPTWSFPVPGFLVGLLYVFHCDTDSYAAAQVNPPRITSLQDIDPQNLPNLRLYWLSVALIFERIALHGIYKKHSAADSFSACLTMLIHGFLISPLFRASHTWRVAGSIGCCLSYLLHNLVNGQLYNPFIIDVCLALCLVDLVNNTPPPKHEDLPRVKVAVL